MLAGTKTGPWGASTGLGQEGRVTPVSTASQEAWPGLSLWDQRPSGKSRGGTPTGERAERSARAAPQGAEDKHQRLPAFRFPFFLW
jgi:hypothetical protein